MIDDSRPSPVRNLLHPVLLLAGLTFGIALLLSPFAISRSGSGGFLGLATAGAICLVTGVLAEFISWSLAGRVQPIATMVLGMTIRMLLPLGVCLYMAVSGASGRQHLAFIWYLLTFYFTTLALETYLTVKRVAKSSPNSSLSAR